MRNKRLRLTLLACAIAGIAGAQTLATVGGEPVTREEFLAAFEKNNAGKKATAAEYRDYLDLYLRYRLKVRAAVDAGLDTLAAQRTEVANFRSQIVDQYMTDNASLDRLVQEAFARGRKDVHAMAMYFSMPKEASPADTLNAWKKAQAALADMRNGKTFGEAAAAWSDDPFAKTNHGDLGWVTVFSLPYALESSLYAAPTGKIAGPFRGPSGYYILKNAGERHALGRLRLSQILLIVPAGSTEAVRADTRKRADSILAALRGGADFASLARHYSGDNLSYQTGGVMPEFGVGRYDPAFEAAAYAIARDGELAGPVESSFGLHILRREYRKPVPAKPDAKYLDQLRDLVRSDARIELSRQEMLRHIRRETGVQTVRFDTAKLWALTDSFAANRPMPAFADLAPERPLVVFPDEKIPVSKWLEYRRNLRANPLNNAKPERALFARFVDAAVFDYYRAHLDRYNPAFAAQLNEFRDGNLLFEIMQREVWNKASADTAALRRFYEANAEKYRWSESAAAIVFTTPGVPIAKRYLDSLRRDPSGWRHLADRSSGELQADSGRFEARQLLLTGKSFPPANSFTDIALNPSDRTAQFAWIARNYPGGAARNFGEARGLALNDCQTELENTWIEGLKKKYPIQVNEAAVKALARR